MIEYFRGHFGSAHRDRQDLPHYLPHPSAHQKDGRAVRTDRVPQQWGSPIGLWACEPLGYLEFLHLNMHAKMVLTDSGGLQEETTVLGVPCITLRENTERPITCTEGTNVIVGNQKDRILEAAREVLDGRSGQGRSLKNGMERRRKGLWGRC